MEYKMSKRLYTYFYRKQKKFKKGRIFPYQYIIGSKDGVMGKIYELKYKHKDIDYYDGCQDLRTMSAKRLIKAVMSLAKMGYIVSAILRVGRPPRKCYRIPIRNIMKVKEGLPLISFSSTGIQVDTFHGGKKYKKHRLVIVK